MMSIGRQITWELHAYIHVHHMTWTGRFINARVSLGISTVHATETVGTRNFMNWRNAWPSSTSAFMHFIKSRSTCRSAGQSKFTNFQFSQILKGVRIWKLYNSHGIHTFWLCENLKLEIWSRKKIERFDDAFCRRRYDISCHDNHDYRHHHRRHHYNHHTPCLLNTIRYP